MRVTVSARQFLGALCFVSCALLACSASAAGRTPAAQATEFVREPDPVNSVSHLEVRALRPGLHLIQGAGGNVIVWSGADGTVLVDTGLETHASELFATVARLSPGPLRFVIDTHGHPDHTGGNATAAERGAVVIGHERLHDTEEPTPAKAQIPPGAATTAGDKPVLTLADALALHLNGDRADVLHVANAHTNADLIVRWSSADVLALGDLYWSQQYPQIDLASGGSLAGLVAAVEAVMARCTSRTIIVPGHGDPTSRSELAAYRDMLVTVGRRVREAVERGEHLQQVLASHPTAEFDAKFAPPDAPAAPEEFVRAVYAELTRRR